MQKQTEGAAAVRVVTERALIKRINRRLARDGEKVRKNSNPRHLMDLGWYYVVDVWNNWFVASHVNLEQLGREVGALAEWEALSDDGGAR
jgi:hypothetical protein